VSTSCAGGGTGAPLLGAAKRDGRIGKLAADPLLPLRAYCDIGGSGANADAFAIWIVQWVGQEIRVLDYYETVGQVLGYHLAWLRESGYQKAKVFLPHDGIRENDVLGKRYVDLIREAEFDVQAIPNEGKGAAARRIEAVRRLLPQCWFHEEKTERGRLALGFYHERKGAPRRRAWPGA
jgi:phage terminase large subunit